MFKLKNTMNDDQQNIYFFEEWSDDCYVIEYEKNPNMYQGIYSGDPIDNSHSLYACLQDVQDCIDTN